MLITFAGQEDRHFFAELQKMTVFLTCKCFSCFIHSRMCQADRISGMELADVWFFLGPFYQRHRHPVHQRGDQFRFPQELRDVCPPIWPQRPQWPNRWWGWVSILPRTMTASTCAASGVGYEDPARPGLFLQLSRPQIGGKNRALSKTSSADPQSFPPKKLPHLCWC